MIDNFTQVSMVRFFDAIKNFDYDLLYEDYKTKIILKFNNKLVGYCIYDANNNLYYINNNILNLL